MKWLSVIRNATLKENFPFASALVVALVLGLLGVSQNADFQVLHEVKPRSCGKIAGPRADSAAATYVLHCHAEFVISPSQPAFIDPGTAIPADLALLAPTFRDAFSVTLNGIPTGQARLNQWRMPARLATVPAIVPITAENLKLGNNRIEIIVTGLAGREPKLGQLFIGREGVVFKQFSRLKFIEEVLPTLILGGQAALSLIFFTMWNRRRQETAFGWFGVVLTLDTIRGTAFIPDFGIESSNVSYWSLLVPFSSAAYLMFACALTELKTVRWIWLAWLGPILVATVAALSSEAIATSLLLPLGIAVVALNLLCAVLVFAADWSRGTSEVRLLLLCTLLIAALILHDVLLSLQLIGGHVAVARSGLLVLLIAMVTVTLNRFTSAMTQFDRSADILKTRTTEIDARLRSAYEQLREEREHAVLEQERARLMRDLHDGLGSEMVAVLALAERDEAKVADIAYHARAALADMRLIIASLEDYGGNLALAFGAWKERAEPQIRAAEMDLHWCLADLDLVTDFGPASVLDILRIFQEALTNVIRHSKASSITVTSQLANGTIILTFEDDGVGISGDAHAGKGLMNMRDRAKELDGDFAITTGTFGTRLSIILPTCSPPL